MPFNLKNNYVGSLPLPIKQILSQNTVGDIYKPIKILAVKLIY
jgi:hypothetical protein